MRVDVPGSDLIRDCFRLLLIDLFRHSKLPPNVPDVLPQRTSVRTKPAEYEPDTDHGFEGSNDHE